MAQFLREIIEIWEVVAERSTLMIQKVPGVLVRMGLAVVLVWSGMGAGSAKGQATATLEATRAIPEGAAGYAGPQQWEIPGLRKSGISPEQADWLKATPEQRIPIAEHLGEQGARQYAQSQGWQPIYQGQDRQIRQGLDLVYQDPATGKIIVIEAKGGTSPLGRGYGYEQGTSEWSVKSAENVLHHKGASPAEREAAKKVIEAAQQGNLEVQVVRTTHVYGKPTGTLVEQVQPCTPKAMELAEEVAKRYGLNGAGGGVVGHSGSGGTVSGNGRYQSPGAVDHAVESEIHSSNAVAGGVKPASRQIQKATQQVEKGVQASERAAAQAAKNLGRTGATVAEGVPRQAGRIASASGKAAGSTLATAGKVAGGAAVAIDAGFRVYDAYQVEQEYHQGQITQQQRTKAHVKNVATAAGGYAGGGVGAWGGATAGAAMGTAICPGIGTAIGGAIGGIAGAIGGYWAGEKAADMAVDSAMGP